ncbi:MAG: FkbM family methyltransferase [Comamonadaceae bacterium]|nr:MAG: FkbM family methyltransferase [Comamonadaceae bacterium]
MTTYELIDGRHGRFLVNRNDSYVGRSLRTYGEWSEGEIALFRQIVRPGDVVVEAGANIGSHTVFLSKAAGEAGCIYAFEAARHTHQLLCANLALNECFNVHARHIAIGRAPGTARFPKLDPRLPGNFGGASMRETSSMDPTAGEDVGVASIDSLGLDRLDFLKADIEGFEPEMLEGARHTLRDLRPVVYLEVDFANGLPTGNRDELVAFLESFGYCAYYYICPMYLPQNTRQVTEDIFNSSSIDLICVPEERARIEGLTRASVGDNAICMAADASGLVYATLPWTGAHFSRIA